MKKTNRHLPRTLAALAVAAGLAAPAAAEAGKILIDVDAPYVRRVKLSAPYFEFAKGPRPCADCPALAREIADLVRWNLEFTQMFELQSIDPEEIRASYSATSAGVFRFNRLARLGLDGVLVGRITPDAGEAYEVVLTLERVDEQRPAFSTKYRATRENARIAAHDFSNAVYREFTGRDGIFGSRVAYVSDETGTKEIYVAELDGTGKRQITKNGTINLAPAWSPDGTRLAFTSYKRKRPEIYVHDLRTGAERVVGDLPGVNVSPAWSPDGRSIIFGASTGANTDLYLVEVESGARTRLSAGPDIEVDPTWSPEGERIAFASDRGGSPQIYVMRRGGGAPIRITYDTPYATSPAWSPNGDRLAYVAQDSGRFDLYTIGIDGDRIVRLTGRARDNEDPSWSADGRWLVFASNREGRRYQLYVVGADGGRPRLLLGGASNLTDPAWGPPTVLSRRGP